MGNKNFRAPKPTFAQLAAAQVAALAWTTPSSGQYVPESPTQVTPTVDQPRSRCSVCRSDTHQEPACFLTHPNKLATFLTRHPDQGSYWEAKVAKHKEMVYQKEQKYAEYLERQKVREGRAAGHQAYLVRQARREAKQREIEERDALMTPEQMAQRKLERHQKVIMKEIQKNGGHMPTF